MTATVGSRNVALDVLRGLTVVMMILVNNPGSWGSIWWPLGHAKWHGYTPTDLVFPFFLFITGSAMFFALKRFNYEPSKEALRKLAKRVFIIFAIGIFLHWYPFSKSFEDLRIMGVLQRIAVAYGIATLAVLYLSTRGLILFGGVLLFGYWVLLFLGGGLDPYSIQHNIVRVVDIAVIGESHMFPYMNPMFEPEGLLSTFPAVVNVLAGYLITKKLSSISLDSEKIKYLAVSGVALIVAGHVWGLLFPIGKNLWTSSYVVVTTGWAFIFLAVLTFICSKPLGSKIMEPFRIYGTNPLFIYAFSWIWIASYWLITMDLNGESVDFATYLYKGILLPALGNDLVASHTYAFIHVVIFWFVSWFMDSRKIYIKI